MLITDGLLLLALASPPTPVDASPPPIQHRTLVAQADGWRGNPPPPPPFEEPVGRPRPGFVWVEGGFDWRRGKYIRHRGHWERVREGRKWHAGHWELQGDHYAWVRGMWVEGPAYVAPPSKGQGARGGISIAGQVVDQTGRPAAGITIVLAGTSEGRTVTDGAGRYAFMGLPPGSYAVRPNDPRCGFRPDVMNLDNLGSNAIQNFGANCR
jgi:hypothetical protein